MTATRRTQSKWRGRIAAAALLAGLAIALGGCCHIPPGCCEDPVPTVVITFENNTCVVKPDETTSWVLHPGDRVKFVNATEAQVTIAPSFGAYAEGNEFSIGAFQAVLRTIAVPGQDPDDHIILHIVECGGDDHGGPKMVVTKPPGGGGSG
jgi:hypothetical protein